MRLLLSLALLSTLGLAACSKRDSPPATPTNAPPAASANPLNAPADYAKALARAQQTAEKTVDLTALTKAVELFQVEKGRLPKDLNELVAEKFIRQLPPAPRGMKLVYDAQTGEVKVQPE